MSSDPSVTVFAAGVQNPEGPVSLPDGSWLVTEMGRGTVTKIDARGVGREHLADTGRPNGLAVDSAGNIWIAESKYPAVLRLSPEGELTEMSRGGQDNVHGLPFLWPNDLCFGPDGTLYVTDSGVILEEMEGKEPPEAAYDIPVDGKVFRVDPESGDGDVLDRGLEFANGIVFGPGDQYLYVSETLTGSIYRYSLLPDGRLGPREYFANVMVKPNRQFGRVAGPDGMAFDAEGNLYVCVLQQGDVTVLGADGNVRSRIPLPGAFPTNIAFDVTGTRQVLVTEGSRGELLFVETPMAGLSLHDGQTR